VSLIRISFSPVTKFIPVKHASLSRRRSIALLPKGCSEGDYPIGVCLKKAQQIQADIKVNGKNKHLGMFEDPYLAHLAWFNEK
jgi:hypothetical protein